MPRRVALALALAFTTVATFGVIAVGAQAGVFGTGNTNTQKSAAQAPPALSPTDMPTQTPIVVTDYIYVDGPTPTPAVGGPPIVPAPQPAVVQAASDAAPTAASVTPVSSPPPTERSESGSQQPQQEPEHEGDDD